MHTALVIWTLLSYHLVTSFTNPAIRTHRTATPTPTQRLLIVRNAVADPPRRPSSSSASDDKRKKDQNRNNGNDEEGGEGEGDDWTPVEGGFLPNIFRYQRGLNIFKERLRQRRRQRRRNEPNVVATTDTTTITSSSLSPTTTKTTNSNTQKRRKSKNDIHYHPNCIEVSDIQSYKTHVADETNALVVVRFYATWCKSCKASTLHFHKLVSKYASSSSSTTTTQQQQHDDRLLLPVKFVQMKLTKETAYLQEGLGVPSVPFVHLYHPEAGLVEEQKFSKGYIPTFENVLEQYVVGRCDLPKEEDEDDEDEEEEGVFE